MIRVVIPARRASGTIEQCVASLRASDLNEPFEIIVVDDGNPDCSLAGRLRGFPVTVRRSRGTGSAAAARNTGAGDVRTGIIVFVDADVQLAPDALKRLIEPMRNGSADAVVGNYSTAVAGLSFMQQYKQLYVSTVYRRRNGEIRNEFWSAIGAVRAEAFLLLGGFDESYRGAAGEDTDFGRRLTEHGFKIVAVPAAEGLHLHPFTLRSVVQNDLKKGTATVFFGLKNRTRLQDNRHSSRRDVAAVVAAYGQIGTIPFLTFHPAAALIFGAAMLLWYLSARADLLRSFMGRGVLFALRAVPVAMLLDLARGVCVARGLAWYIFGIEPVLQALAERSPAANP